MVTRPFESRVQELVYHVDVGTGLHVIKKGLFILAILLIVGLYYLTQFTGLKDAEAMEYAQLGRNMMMHKKMVTQCIRPLGIWVMSEKSPKHNAMLEQHPDILHPPLYPAVLATLFSATHIPFEPNTTTNLYKPEERIIIPLGILFTLLTGMMLYVMAKKMFDRRLAILSVAVFFLSNTVMQMSISGLNIPMLSFFTITAMYCMITAIDKMKDDTSIWAWSLPMGLSFLFCVLAFYTRYGGLLILPALLLMLGIMIPRNKGLWIGGYLLAFIICILPWLLRNKLISGGIFGMIPYTLLTDSRLSIGDQIERTLTPALTFSSFSGALVTKFLNNFNTYFNINLRTIGDGFLICLFITTFLHRFIKPTVRWFRWGLALSIALTIFLTACFGGTSIRLLYIFWPFIIMYGLSYLIILIERLQLEYRILNIGILTVFIMSCSLPLVITLLPPRAENPYPPYYPPLITRLCDMLKPNELLCTDMPWATAWYGHKDSLLLPNDVNSFYEINDYHKRISALYFTTLTLNQPYVRTLRNGMYASWMPVLELRMSDFPLNSGIPLNNGEQLFLTDRPRWNE